MDELVLSLDRRLAWDAAPNYPHGSFGGFSHVNCASVLMQNASRRQLEASETPDLRKWKMLSELTQRNRCADSYR